MTEAVSFAQAGPDALILIEAWRAPGDRLDALTGPLSATGRSVDHGPLRVLGWEAGAWLVRAPIDRGAELATAIVEALGDGGAAFDLSGAWTRVRLSGPRSRELLMIGAVFDAEGALPPGTVAGTLLHHLPVRLDAIDAQTVDVYVAPSWREALLDHWRAAQRRWAAR